MLLGDRHDAIYQLNHGRNLIGRDESNTVVLNDRQISKQHTAIMYDNDQFWIEDTLSKNGVFLNGRKVESRQKLFHGCVIKLGATILRFETAYWR
jgi:pSer/pThr/pTyr-binding forkhead associated (FHA) protein